MDKLEKLKKFELNNYIKYSFYPKIEQNIYFEYYRNINSFGEKKYSLQITLENKLNYNKNNCIIVFRDNLLNFIENMEELKNIVSLSSEVFVGKESFVDPVYSENFIYYLKNFGKKYLYKMLQIDYNYFNNKELTSQVYDLFLIFEKDNPADLKSLFYGNILSCIELINSLNDDRRKFKEFYIHTDKVLEVYKVWFKLVEMVFVNPPTNPNSTLSDYVNDNCEKSKINKLYMTNIKNKKILESRIILLNKIFRKIYENCLFDELLSFRLIDFYNFISFGNIKEFNSKDELDFFIKLHSGLDKFNVCYNENLFLKEDNKVLLFSYLSSPKSAFDSVFMNKELNAKIKLYNDYENKIFIDYKNNTLKDKLIFLQHKGKTIFLNDLNRNMFYGFEDSYEKIYYYIISNFTLEEIKTIDTLVSNNIETIEDDKELFKALTYYLNSKNFELPIKLATSLYFE